MGEKDALDSTIYSFSNALSLAKHLDPMRLKIQVHHPAWASGYMRLYEELIFPEAAQRSQPYGKVSGAYLGFFTRFGNANIFVPRKRRCIRGL